MAVQVRRPLAIRNPTQMPDLAPQGPGQEPGQSVSLLDVGEFMRDLGPDEGQLMSFEQSASVETNTWCSLHICIIPGRRHWERPDGLLGASSSPFTEIWLPAWDHSL